MKNPVRTEKSAPPLTIPTMVVDDEQLAREELAYLLKAHPEIEVVAQGQNGLEAVKLIREYEPDLLFLDVQMPGLDGFGVIKELIAKKQNSRILSLRQPTTSTPCRRLKSTHWTIC